MKKTMIFAVAALATIGLLASCEKDDTGAQANSALETRAAAAGFDTVEEYEDWVCEQHGQGNHEHCDALPEGTYSHCGGAAGDTTQDVSDDTSDDATDVSDTSDASQSDDVTDQSTGHGHHNGGSGHCRG